MVAVASESSTAHPTRSAHAEETRVVSASINEVVMHRVATSVSQFSGSAENVGWWLGPILYGSL